MAKKKEQITIREYISQIDIDQLLESAFVEQAEAADELELELSDLSEATTFDADREEDDQRLISNDDIGALFKIAGAKGVPKAPSSDDDIASMVSQSDIDALLSGGLDSAAPPTSAESELEDDTGGLISQGDIDALLSGSLGSAESELEDDTGGLISQGDIDALLKGEMAAGEVPAPEAAGGDGMVSQADIDALLNGAESGGEDAGDHDSIFKSDIDSLLGESAKKQQAADEAFEPRERNKTGDVISQSDIDALLMGALDSEEEADDLNDGDIDARSVSQGDIDSLLGESPDALPSKEKAAPPEPVILAEDAEMLESPAPLSLEPSRPWYKRKAYRISAVAALVFIISSSAFLMMPRSRDTGPNPVVLTFPISTPESQVATTSVQGDTHVAMPGFLVLAPSDNNDVTCLAADLEIVLSDTKTVRRIKDNERFVRNIIYGVINDALLSRDKSAVDRTKLAAAVRAALGHVVPVEMVRTVYFGNLEIIQ